MNEAQFEAAKKLKDEKHKIRKELEIWERELTNPSKLGYLAGWNNNHPTRLDTRIPADVFVGFRTASMNALRLRLVEIDQEFEKI